MQTKNPAGPAEVAQVPAAGAPVEPLDSHRDETDQSLREERDKSDSEVVRRNESAAGVADAVLEQARSNADSILRHSRDQDPVPRNLARDNDRREEDALIERQRTDADELIGEERRERTRALAALFAIERESTDQHLRAERNRADTALNNRDEFLGMVAHDLRGFMGDIMLRASVLRRDPRSDEAGNKTRQIGLGIQRSTAGMKRLVGDLLDIAAIEAGRLQVDVTRGDVASILRDALEPFRFAAQVKGISLELGEAPESSAAIYDHDRVIQVLGNLVGNAVKYTPAGGTISLRLARAGGQVQFSVSDTGAGIPPDMLEKIFERFAQVRSDRRGLGLGLYISRCLVEAQGGRIWATSTPGAGTCVSFTLPAAP